MTATAFIWQNRGWFSFKTNFFMTVIATAIFVANGLIYIAQDTPAVWVGDCTVVAGRDNPLASCKINDKVVLDRISLKNFYAVLVDHKTLWCAANKRDDLTCYIK